MLRFIPFKSINHIPMRRFSIIFEQQNNRIATITLNYPKQRNVLEGGVIKEIKDKLELLQSQFMKKEDYTKVVIIQAEGSVFSAGHNLKQVKGMTPDEQKKLFTDCGDLMLYIRQMSIPVIASVQGLATAAGTQLVAACDMALASNNAHFSVSGVKVGLFCTTPGVQLQRSMSSDKKTFEMLTTGENISAKEALQFGLINKIIEDNGDINVLRSESIKFAQLITRHSAETIQLGKKAFYNQIQILDIDKAYDYATDIMVQNLQLQDTKEGIQAFMEKRPAKFKN